MKGDDLRRTTRLPATKTSLVVACLIALIVCSVIGTQVLIPFKLIRDQIRPSIYSDDVQPLSYTRLEDTKRISNENAEELLIDSLVLLRNLLIRISEGDGSAASSRKRSTQSSKHVARAAASDISSFFSNISSSAGASGGIAQFLASSPLGTLANSLADGASDASKFLGIGLGNGTITGLDLPPNLRRQNTALIEKPTGINAIAANLGQGLTSSIVGSINFNQIASGSPETIGLSARAIGEGAGNGAAAGLNLKPMSAFSNTSDIPGIARNLAQGLTSSFLGGVDFRNLAMSFMGNVTGDQINSAAKSLAQGLGSGAAFATNLSSVPPSSKAFDSTGINGITGNLGQGLSTSFLQDIKFRELLTSNAPKLTQLQISDAAKGLGAGLAGGAVVGVGLQPDNVGTSVNLIPGGLGVTTESFGRGLSQSFLSNGTISKVMALGQGTQSQMNIASVAKGLAIGLVDGATTSIDNSGGVDKLLNLNTTAPPKVQKATKQTQFDDTVGGAAVGFGNGLGLQGTTFILQLIGKPPQNQSPTIPGSPTLDASPSGVPAKAPPSNGTTTKAVTVSRLRRRQTAEVLPPATPQAPKNITAADILNIQQFNGTITPIVQKAVDTLQCQGVGGLASILFTVGGSQLLSSGANVDELRDKISKFGFAKQTITIKEKYSGNQYEINIARSEIKINGNDFRKEIIVLIIHIILAIISYPLIIPTITMISSIRNFAVMSGRSGVLENGRRTQWYLALGVVLPCTLVVFALGIVTGGTKQHFRTPHGILGLALTLFTLPAFPLAYFAVRNKAKSIFSINIFLILSLIMLVLITGFLDLSSLAFCVFQILPLSVLMVLGILLATPLLLASTLIGLEFLLEHWLESNSIIGNARRSALFSGRWSRMKPEDMMMTKSNMEPEMGRNEKSKNPKNFMEI